MVIINYRKVKCDECGKEVEMKEEIGSLPDNWFEVSITKWFGTTGDRLFHKEVCSEKCAMKTLKKLNKLPKPKPIHIY